MKTRISLIAVGGIATLLTARNGAAIWAAILILLRDIDPTEH